MEKGTEKGTAKKMTAPVSSEQISRTDELSLLLASMKGHLIHIYMTWVMNFNTVTTTDWKGPASSQAEERSNQVYWTVWIQRLGTSDPQKY